MGQRAVWIDHNEARVFHLEGTTFDEKTIHANQRHIHRHPRDQETKVRNHPQDETRFFDEVIAAVTGTEALLLMGPSVTKLRFLRYVEKQAPAVAASIMGIETAAHATDAQLVAHIRHYFHDDPPRLGHAPRPGA